MSPLAIGLLVFACVFVSGLLGLYLRSFLPDHHLREESIGVVKLGVGLVATLAALVLGLLIASAKASYDEMGAELTQAAARVVLLDRTLAQYGPETGDARRLLRTLFASLVETMFSGHDEMATLEVPDRVAKVDQFQEQLQDLAPQDDKQRRLQARALEISGQVAQARWLVITRGQGSLPTAFLVVLVIWLAILFAGFGVVTAANPTVVVTLLLCALSVAGSVFLIEEMNHPLEGLVRVSSAPMRNALAHLAK
jgi:hypothetical protein